MPYLIDGHNLIGQMTHISLSDPHDEAELVIRLRSYSAHLNKKFHVVFDGGLPAGDSALGTSRVKVHFASSSSTADNVLMKIIRRTKDGRNWTVVTSDNVIVSNARRKRMNCVPSHQFAQRLERFLDGQQKAEDAQIIPKVKEDPKLSKNEVDEWLDLFNNSD